MSHGQRSGYLCRLFRDWKIALHRWGPLERKAVAKSTSPGQEGFFLIWYSIICVSWFADEAAAPPSLPPSSQCTPGPCNVGLGSREHPGWHTVLGCSRTSRMVKVRRPLLGIPNFLGGSHSSCSPAAFVLLLHQPPQTFLPLVSL